MGAMSSTCDETTPDERMGRHKAVLAIPFQAYCPPASSSRVTGTRQTVAWNPAGLWHRKDVSLPNARPA
jgi:hypothetical protein